MLERDSELGDVNKGLAALIAQRAAGLERHVYVDGLDCMRSLRCGVV